MSAVSLTCDVLIDTLGLGRQGITGMERYAIEMLNGLQRLQNRGFSFQVVVQHGSAVRGEFSRITARGPAEILQQCWLPYAMYQTGAALVVAMGLGATVLGWWPFLVVLHDTVPWTNARLTGRRTRWYAKPTWNLALHSNRCEGVIPVSYATQEAVCARFNGIKVFAPTGEGATDLGTGERPAGAPDRFLLVVGTNEPRKNLSGIVKAFKTLRNTSCAQDAELVVVGRVGWGAADINDLDGVRPLGYVSDAQLAWLYDHAVGLVFVPFAEGFGLPALEAISRRCPVLASDIPPLREIGRGSFVFADPHNIESICKGMRELLALGREGVAAPPQRVDDWGVAAGRLALAIDRQLTLVRQGAKRKPSLIGGG